MRNETRSCQSLAITDVCYEPRIARKSGRSLRRLVFLSFMLFICSLLAPVAICNAEVDSSEHSLSNTSTLTPTTLVIFSDPAKPTMSDNLWSDIIDSLRDELDSDSQQLRAPVLQHTASLDVSPMPVSIVRGEQITPGFQVQNSITIYLHGECKAATNRALPFLGSPHTLQSHALGWVLLKNGRIEPFIHVDCASLGQMLTIQAIGRSSNQRDQLIAVAIARVIMHEWIHIATQNPHHAKQGIEKAQFEVADLLVHKSKSSASQQHLRSEPVISLDRPRTATPGE